MVGWWYMGRIRALEEALTKQRAVNKALLAELKKIMGDALPSETYKRLLITLQDTLE